MNQKTKLKELEKELIQKLEKLFSNKSFEVEELAKANKFKRGLLIKEKNNENQIACIYYLDNLHDTTLEETIKEVSELIKVGAPNISNEEIYNKENFTIGMINTLQNEHYLKDAVCKEFLDLTAILIIDVPSINGKIKITNQILNLLNISEHEAFSIAYENILKETSFMSFQELIQEFDFIDFIDFSSKQPMYMLKNDSGGASAILVNEKLKELSDMVDSDLYIIPSSRYEVLVFPKKFNLENTFPKVLKEMLIETNRTSVLPEDWLSDSIYIYNRKREEVSILL